MRLSIKNSELIKKAKNYINRSSKIGPIIKMTGLVLAGLIIGNAYGNNQAEKFAENQPNSGVIIESNEFDDVPMREQIHLSPDETIVEPTQEEAISVSLEDVNSMNIIINDANCMDDFINSVCEQLDRDGIKFSYTTDCKNIDVDNAVVLTLDQQYMAGPRTAIFAPLQNGRNGNSDALALATERAFYEKGFLIDGIACGQMGFRENPDGTISERVPTQTEEAINENTDASYVTVSFGTSNTNAELVAKAIEGSLTRYCSYIKNNQVDSDLIYCVQPNEGRDEVAEHFGTSSDEIKDTEDSPILPGKTTINPNIDNIREFSRSVPTNLYVDKTIWSK